MQFEKLVNNILLNEWVFTDNEDSEKLNLSDNETYTIFCGSEGFDDELGDMLYTNFSRISPSLKELGEHLELIAFFESPLLNVATSEEGNMYFEGKGFALKKAAELFAKIGRLQNLEVNQKEKLFNAAMTNFLQAHEDLRKHTSSEEQGEITNI